MTKLKIPILLAVIFLPAFSFAQTPAPTEITADTIWTAEGSPYLVGKTAILPGVTLTLEPGTIVKFKQSNVSITVSGTLNANGTKDNPIYFTSIQDDIGEDTNGDGNATAPGAGQWSSLNISPDGNANLAHSIFRYGGYAGAEISNEGILLIADSAIVDSRLDGIVGTGTTTVSGTVFERNKRYGIFTSGSGAVNVQQSTFRKNAFPGVFHLQDGATVRRTGNTASENIRNGFLTRMDGENVKSQIFDADNGIPYIIAPQGANIPPGKTLTIAAGAIIKPSQSNTSIEVNGTLDIQGTKEHPVSFTALSDDSIGGDTDGDAPLWYMHSWAAINVNDGGTARIDHAVLKKGGYWNAPVSNNGGTLNISNSLITESLRHGIYSNSTTTANHNSISGNASFGIYNETNQIIDAENNWWGSPTGPRHASNPGGAGQRVTNFVDFTPWLTSDPTLETPLALGIPTLSEDDGKQDAKGIADKTNFTFSMTAEGNPDSVSLFVDGAAIPLAQTGNAYTATSTFPKGHYTWHIEATKGTETVSTAPQTFTTGYSNVAFLPGLEASRLYTQGALFENQLWEPNRNDDVRELYLNLDGTSINPDIYTQDAVDEVGVPGFKTTIYKGFLDHMEGMVTSGDIREVDIFPYDWRKDQKDVATELVSIGSNGEFYSMIQRIEDMASSSPTGKVSIVTHSNGGLVAKELTEILNRQGKANTIEQIIMVAAPQLGTPKAIFETLHGTEFFLGLPSKEVTRELAENMKSAYALLPSRGYFNRLGAPIRPLVEFSTTTPATEYLRNIYGNSISDYDTLRRFLRGENGVRTEPIPSDVNTPNVLKENFLANAELRHTFQDVWTPPEGIKVVQIIGWGLDTLRGVRYGATKKRICNTDLSVCVKEDVIDPRPLSTSEGDGTVVYISAESTTEENKYYLNLREYNNFVQASVSHASILEVGYLQDFVVMLIKHESTSTLPTFLSNAIPFESDMSKRLRIGVHSPVTLNLYDSLGRHTGPVPNPDPTSDFELHEEQIPNSYYWQIGEGQYAGADGATTTVVELKGTDIGTFTLDVEHIIGDVTATTTVYEDIPVTASTTAIIQVSTATMTPLLLDIDGDGKTDASITAGGLTAEDLAGILKGLVKILNLPTEKEKKLVKKIEKLEKELQKEHKNERNEKRKTAHAFEEILKTINKYEKKRVLTHNEAAELISIIERIRETMVE